MAFNPPSPQDNNGTANEQFVAETISVGMPWRLFISSAIIFLLSIIAYFGISFGYLPYLQSESDKADKGIESLAKAVTLDEQDRLIGFYSQIVNLQAVLDKHPYTSSYFKFLEKNTLDKIYFSEAETQIGNTPLKLKGFADSFDSLAQQMTVFQKAPEISEAVLEDVSLAKSTVNFTIDLKFKGDFLNKPLQ
jgi:hypothetical protein